MSTTSNNLATFAETNNKNPMNHSVSKMRYSFPKTKRFDYGYGKDSSKQFIYNLPEVQGKRGTSLGYGKKSNFMHVEEYKKASLTDTRNNFGQKKGVLPQVIHLEVPGLCMLKL